MGHNSGPVRSNPLIRRIESTVRLEKIWKRGLIHPGGPHYRLPGTRGPVSIGADECELIGRIIARFQPAHAFLIGNGFGFSSTFIAKSMEAASGRSVISLDSMQEGDGTRCHQTAEALRTGLDCRLLKNIYGISPQDIGRSAEQEHYDFVFIDGGHAHPQVTRDFEGARQLLPRRGVVVWHDHWLPGVAASVEAARRDGMHCLELRSSCEMVAGTWDGAVFARLRELFPGAGPPLPRKHRAPRLVFARAALRSMLAS